MIEFSKITLGAYRRLVALTAKSIERSGKELIIQKIKKLNVKKNVVSGGIPSFFNLLLPYALLN